MQRRYGKVFKPRRGGKLLPFAMRKAGGKLARRATRRRPK